MAEFDGVSSELICYVASAMEALRPVASPRRAVNKFLPPVASSNDWDMEEQPDSPYANYFAEFGVVVGSHFDILALVENTLNLYALSLPSDLSNWPPGSGALGCRVMEVLDVVGISIGNTQDGSLYLDDGLVYIAKSRKGIFLAMCGTTRFIKSSVERNFSEATRLFLSNPENFPYYMDESGLLRDREGDLYAFPVQMAEGGEDGRD